MYVASIIGIQMMAFHGRNASLICENHLKMFIVTVCSSFKWKINNTPADICEVGVENFSD